MEQIPSGGISGMAAKRIGAALQRALISDTTAHATTPAPAVRKAA
jgi:hypothetical protein